MTRPPLTHSLELIKLRSDSPDKPELDRINNEAFAEAQRTSIDALFQSDTGELDILGIYHDHVLAGFFTVRSYQTIAYLGYFAIAQTYRSQGIGSSAIAQLKDYYADKQIVVEIESLHEACDNMAERIRRRKFYLTNGMISTGWYLYYDDVELEILCSEPDFHQKEFEEITERIHSLYYDFIPQLYRKET